MVHILNADVVEDLLSISQQQCLTIISYNEILPNNMKQAEIYI